MLEVTIGGVQVFWPALVGLGLLIGFLTGLFGVGGGFLLTPCLRILFGVPYPVAVGSDLVQIFCTGSVSAFKHWRRGDVDVKLGVLLAAGAATGSFLGKEIMSVLQQEAGSLRIAGRSQPMLDVVMNLLFLALMAAVAVSIIREKTQEGGDTDRVDTVFSQRLRKLALPPRMSFETSGTSFSLWVPVGVALVVGMLTGLMGVGGGFIMFPLLVYVLGVSTVAAVGTGAFQIVFATGAGAMAHFSEGHVSLPLVGFLLVGSITGVQLGVRLSHRLAGRRLRRYFAGVLSLGILLILYSLAGQFGVI
ncbi:sulfite exporter TauE/SafE family protein [Kiritimatiella glycovorans]|uniref:Probable membrane transporter protein n=1 Tax=Kiritimatiella glycovorans TaxID=1307763 RepID=A0A0G3EF82_9BACT|nr:sulfite exporter TauE/SafE family protein [Kiritimatiella glycovorans]AKJ63435.1 Sulfite exporter TauE/SafE [Kiritimatiella glycovorans]